MAIQLRDLHSYLTEVIAPALHYKMAEEKKLENEEVKNKVIGSDEAEIKSLENPKTNDGVANKRAENKKGENKKLKSKKATGKEPEPQSAKKRIFVYEKGTHIVDAYTLLVLDLPSNVQMSQNNGLHPVIDVFYVTHTEKDWNDYLKQCVSHVLVNIVRDESSLKNVGVAEGVYVFVKPECAEEWMWVPDITQFNR